MNNSAQYRNVLVLACGQGLVMTGTVMTTIVASLAGILLSDDPGLATLPMALQMTATMLMATPASLIMSKIGRRAGFTIGQIIGILGGLIAAYTLLYAHSFVLLCLAGAMIGSHVAFWQLSRFAVVDASDESFRPRAISLVLAGGVSAALVGPEIAKLSVDLFAPVLYAGTYLAFCSIGVISIITVQFLKLPRPSQNMNFRGGRPMREIARQPTFLLALFAGMVGYSMMVLVMTATPLSMQSSGFDFSDTAYVIQWHVLFMFAPGFFTGNLIKRFGVTVIIMAGTFLTMLSMVSSLSGLTLPHFWVALALIGVGWNFMFVGGTTLLIETYTTEERAKVQAFNDTLVFGTTAVASFSSGALLNWLGWDAVNMAILVPTLLLFIGAFLVRRKRHLTTATDQG